MPGHAWIDYYEYTLYVVNPQWTPASHTDAFTVDCSVTEDNGKVVWSVG